MQPFPFITSIAIIYTGSYLLVNSIKKTFILTSISSEPLFPFACVIILALNIGTIILGLNSLFKSLN